MIRSFLFLVLMLGFAAPVWSQEKAEDKAPTAAEKVKADPGDAAAWNTYAGEQFRAISGLLQSDPKAAQKKLEELEAFVGSTEAYGDAAKAIVTRIKTSIISYKGTIEVAQTSLADLEKRLDASPDDVKALSGYTRKINMELGMLARSEPAKAEAQLAAAKDRLNKVRELAKEETTKTSIDTTIKGFANLERTIASSKKLIELVGKDAAPLAVETWVNGKPLTDADLKGKVVLLDFWAVWCGPCIATFPHLRDWNKEYGDKGLVIIGLTSYYKYKWNDDTKKAARSDGEVSHEDEQAMLVKFAEMHSLKHRFAIQDGKSMSEYYAVSGIPHVVIIDQQGKVQMIRVGSGEKNANDISELLKKLLADKPTSK